MKQKIAWTIAGSDSGGGAGIQADLKTFQAFGVHGCSIITAITAQNSLRVDDIYYLQAKTINAQLQSLTGDLDAAAIKIGMLSDADSIEVIAEYLKHYSGFVVYDPVMASSSGKGFIYNNKVVISKLIPQLDLITPNLLEAQQLTGRKIIGFNDIVLCAMDLINLGVKNVLIKGGHGEDKSFCHDYWTDGHESFWLANVRINSLHSHGSGCVLSSSIAANIAQGYSLNDALVIANMYVHQGIRLASSKGQGPGPVVIGGFPNDFVDLPYLTHSPLKTKPHKFTDCGAKKLGLYPILDDSAEVLKLVKQGITTIQLRIKNPSQIDLESQIMQSIKIARHYNCRLFINDYWQLAIKHDAYGIHLGQSDIETADIDLIRKSGLRLGISTHCFYEVARAHAINPSYIACGPIFPTTTKVMPFEPQGVMRLNYWCQLLEYPVVAIGGINRQRVKAVLKTGVSGMAMISAVDALCYTDRS